MHQNFMKSKYQFRRKFWSFLGAQFHIYDESNQLAFYSKMKAFKLKEDISVFADEVMTEKLLSIQARQIIDFSAAYDVTDVETGEKVGALQRKGLKSLIRDEWIILDENDKEIALIQEDSGSLAVLRRFVDLAALLIPQKYNVKMDGEIVATLNQNFNPFIYKLTIDFTKMKGKIDPRLGIAAAVLLGAIEGKQK